MGLPSVQATLEQLGAAMRTARPEELRALVPVLVAMTLECLARFTLDGRTGPRATVAPGSPDRLLTAQEAASLGGPSARWFYEHAHELPFARRITPRVVRFSERGLRQWLESKRG